MLIVNLVLFLKKGETVKGVLLHYEYFKIFRKFLHCQSYTFFKVSQTI